VQKIGLKVEFLLKTARGYPRDAEVILFTLARPGSFELIQFLSKIQLPIFCWQKPI